MSRNLLIAIVAVGLVTVGYEVVSRTSHTQTLTLSGSRHTQAEAASEAQTISAMSTMQADMNSIINNQTDLQVAVSMVDFDTAKTYNAGESDVVYRAASTAKLIAVITYLHEVELGNASLSQTIGDSSAQQNIKQMIEVSDNTAWENINDYLGDTQATYAQSIGLTSFADDTNTITSADMVTLLAKLYNGTLLNSAHRSLLYSYMANSDATDLIKSSMPAGATVYHKYGEFDGELHDTAIVSYNGHHFALVIFTKSSTDDTSDHDAQVAIIDKLAAVAAQHALN